MRTRAFLLLLLVLSGSAFAEVDLSIIADIESGGGSNPKAYDTTNFDKGIDGLGLFQITPACLADFNQYTKKGFKKEDLLDDDKNRIVAEWYFTKRIPQLLRHYKLPQTDENILYAWNSGIGNLIKGNVNKNYVEKYERKKGEQI